MQPGREHSRPSTLLQNTRIKLAYYAHLNEQLVFSGIITSGKLSSTSQVRKTSFRICNLTAAAVVLIVASVKLFVEVFVVVLVVVVLVAAEIGATLALVVKAVAAHAVKY